MSAIDATIFECTFEDTDRVCRTTSQNNNMRFFVGITRQLLSLPPVEHEDIPATPLPYTGLW